MENNISQKSFEQAYENRRLVFGAVKAAGVYYYRNDYEDFVSDGLMVYAQMIENNQQMKKHDLDKLAFKKVMWKTIDSLRRAMRLQELTEFSLDTFTKCYDGEFDNKLIESKNVISPDLLVEISEAKLGLNNIERLILAEHFIKGKKLCEISDEFGVGIKALNRAKKQAQQYLQQFVTY